MTIVRAQRRIPKRFVYCGITAGVGLGRGSLGTLLDVGDDADTQDELLGGDVLAAELDERRLFPLFY